MQKKEGEISYKDMMSNFHGQEAGERLAKEAEEKGAKVLKTMKSNFVQDTIVNFMFTTKSESQAIDLQPLTEEKKTELIKSYLAQPKDETNFNALTIDQKTELINLYLKTSRIDENHKLDTREADICNNLKSEAATLAADIANSPSYGNKILVRAAGQQDITKLINDKKIILKNESGKLSFQIKKDVQSTTDIEELINKANKLLENDIRTSLKKTQEQRINPSSKLKRLWNASKNSLEDIIQGAKQIIESRSVSNNNDIYHKSKRGAETVLKKFNQYTKKCAEIKTNTITPKLIEDLQQQINQEAATLVEDKEKLKGSINKIISPKLTTGKLDENIRFKKIPALNAINAQQGAQGRHNFAINESSENSSASLGKHLAKQSKRRAAARGKSGGHGVPQ